MAANPYPNLGWNPVPGIPSEVESLKKKVSTAAKALRSCHDQIEKLVGESSYWEGDAATKFRDALKGELPTYIKNAARSLEKAATQLTAWDGDLTANRDLARKYDDEAGEKKSAANKAQGRYDNAKDHPDLKLAGQTFPSAEEADAATQRLRAAERDLAAANASLNAANQAYDDVIAKAQTLEGEHSEKAGKIAKSLSEATDKLAPEEPGWLEKAVGAIWDGIKWVGQQILEHAGTIGAIAGLLALLPTPAAPIFAAIAIGASVLSMGKNLADPNFRGALMGEGSGMDTFAAWASLAGDAVGMIPGGKALGAAGSELSSGLRMADDMGVAVTRAEKATEFAREFGHVFKSDALDSSVGAWARAGESTSGSAKYMGALSANGVNVGANTVSSLEEEGVVSKDGAAHDAAESTKAAVTAYNIAALAGVV